VKGAALLSRRSFARNVYGEGSWRKILDTLSDEDRRELQGAILASTWHSFELNQRLDAAIVEILGKGDKQIFEQIGRWSAKQNLTGPHKAFAARRDVRRFLSATDRIYDLYYDTGNRTYEETGPRSGVITTYEAETFSETDCLTVVGWYKEALEMCGATDVEIVEESCRARGGEACRYRVGWNE
jgi:predicted hydrocarbon binding protein